ncbi:MAG: Rap1a/Tai family immunity protein [Acidiferrobacterales bacterium]
MRCRTTLAKSVLGVLVGVLLCCFDGQTAYALDGKELATTCGDEQNPIRRSLCIGYITGVSETLTTVLPVSGICAPAGLSPGQLRTTVTTHLADHPESLSRPAVGVIWTALVEAWPCAGMKPQ